MWTLDDVLQASPTDLREIVDRGAPLDLDVLADSTYTGIDLSMPSWFHRLMWKSFRKTFHRDPTSGVVRGWNVKVEQTGWASPPEPKRDGQGRPLTFGHYVVRDAGGRSFPGGWSGGHFLDYITAGNRLLDWPARAGWCPLVAVNPGDMQLLLGWEVFRIGGLPVPLPDYWVLTREGPLAPGDVVAVPRS